MTDTSVWLDLISPSHPFLFEGVVGDFSNVRKLTTVRRKTETVELAREAGFEFETLGRDFDNVALRTAAVPLRTLQLVAQAPAADVSLSARNAMCVLASRACGIPSIHFTDNDMTAYVDASLAERAFCRFRSTATRHVVPSAFRTSELTRWGADPERIHTYDGYKEDIYIAGFEPDEAFTEGLPFETFVVVRRPWARPTSTRRSRSSPGCWRRWWRTGPTSCTSRGGRATDRTRTRTPTIASTSRTVRSTGSNSRGTPTES